MFDQLWVTLKPMLAYFGGGLALGIALGLLICLTLLKPRTQEVPEGELSRGRRTPKHTPQGSRSAPVA